MCVTIFCTSMGEPSSDSAKRIPIRTLSPCTKAGNEIALHMATFNGDKVNGLREEQMWFVDPPSPGLRPGLVGGASMLWGLVGQEPC